MSFDLARGIALLDRTPTVLRTLLGGLSDEWTRANEGPETWSPFDVVGHLIDGEETDWMARARIILAQGEERRFEPFDRFRHLRVNQGKPLSDLLDRFERLRSRNLEDLRAMDLGPEELALTGEHPDFGAVTLEQLLATWVTHDLNHLAQIARVMAVQNREAVGPWAEFLSVLQR